MIRCQMLISNDFKSKNNGPRLTGGVFTSHKISNIFSKKKKYSLKLFDSFLSKFRFCDLF